MWLTVMVGLVMGALWWEAAKHRDEYCEQRDRYFAERNELAIFFFTMTLRDARFRDDGKLAFDYLTESVAYTPSAPVHNPNAPPPIPR
jgi:hypothetical protein